MARKFLETSSYVKVEELGDNDKKMFKSQYRNCKWLVSLSNGKVGTCKVDDKGGPGALVWMVIAGLLGMALKFAEATLGVKYRKI